MIGCSHSIITSDNNVTMTEKLKQSWDTLKDSPPVNDEPPLLAFSETFYAHFFEHHPGK